MDDNDMNAMLCEILQSLGIDAWLKGVMLPLSGKDETYVGIDKPYTDIMTIHSHNGTVTVQHERVQEDWSIDLADPDSLDKLVAAVLLRQGL